VNKNSKSTFTRSDIEKALLKRHPNLSINDIKTSTALIFDEIFEAIALDNKVEIRGFGTFSKKYIRPRKYINPKTKKILFLGETSTIHFKPSKLLIEK
tara:strand:- start:181 stop:474 length:294 start_codon:yes stop_codon:yes gene_type:complete